MVVPEMLKIPEVPMDAQQLPAIVANILLQVDAKIAEESAKITGTMRDDVMRDINATLYDQIGDKVRDNVREMGKGIMATVGE